MNAVHDLNISWPNVLNLMVDVIRAFDPVLIDRVQSNGGCQTEPRSPENDSVAGLFRDYVQTQAFGHQSHGDLISISIALATLTCCQLGADEPVVAARLSPDSHTCSRIYCL